MLSIAQHKIHSKYLTSPKGLNQSVSAGKGSDMVSDVTDVAGESPLSLSAQTFGSFGAGTAWRSKHIGLKGIQKGNIKTVVDFNTNQVDPSVR
jgi:hypothetical protein